jgi:AcrR family transcriptional regulator
MPQDVFDAPAAGGETDRRRAVLESALETFSRFGYRKTSMDDVAKAAHISRPGLYFLFDSKPALFREAVTHALDRDLGLIAQQLGDSGLPLAERVISAFDRWAGSYIGPLTGEVPGLSDADPALFGSMINEAPRRFEKLVTTAISQTYPADGTARTQTLISASIGIKHEAHERAAYLERLEVAVGLLLN